MQVSNTLIVTAGVVALLSATALAAVTDLREMKDGTEVSLTGTVEKISNAREFTLRDSTGSIPVNIKSNDSVVLKQGDTVVVNGVFDKGFIRSEVDATSVSVSKTVTQVMNDAIEGNTTLSLEGATTYHIVNLPKEGFVKISGTVTDVNDEKNFTLRDNTGSIKIDVKSAEAAAVTEGAKVTVIGYVDDGITGKSIDAKKVLVVADAGSTPNMSRY